MKTEIQRDSHRKGKRSSNLTSLLHHNLHQESNKSSNSSSRSRFMTHSVNRGKSISVTTFHRPTCLHLASNRSNSFNSRIPMKTNGICTIRRLTINNTIPLKDTGRQGRSCKRGRHELLARARYSTSGSSRWQNARNARRLRRRRLDSKS